MRFWLPLSCVACLRLATRAPLADHVHHAICLAFHTMGRFVSCQSKGWPHSSTAAFLGMRDLHHPGLFAFVTPGCCGSWQSEVWIQFPARTSPTHNILHARELACDTVRRLASRKPEGRPGPAAEAFGTGYVDHALRTALGAKQRFFSWKIVEWTCRLATTAPPSYDIDHVGIFAHVAMSGLSSSASVPRLGPATVTLAVFHVHHGR